MIFEKKIIYFPWAELLLFSLIFFTLVISCIVSTFNILISLVIILFSYFFTISQVQVLQLTPKELQIISFNPFNASCKIQIESIVDIESRAKLKYDSTITTEVYPVFVRTYVVHFTDKNKKRREAFFTVNNKRKETEILTSLRAMLGERLIITPPKI